MRDFDGIEDIVVIDGRELISVWNDDEGWFEYFCKNTNDEVFLTKEEVHEDDILLHLVQPIC